jgi:hypothetical protein
MMFLNQYVKLLSPNATPHLIWLMSIPASIANLYDSLLK